MGSLTHNNRLITWSSWINLWLWVILINNYLLVADIYLIAKEQIVHNDLKSPKPRASLEAVKSFDQRNQIDRAEYLIRNMKALGKREN
jgi:hypothetical protein